MLGTWWADKNLRASAVLHSKQCGRSVVCVCKTSTDHSMGQLALPASVNPPLPPANRQSVLCFRWNAAPHSTSGGRSELSQSNNLTVS